MNDEILLIQLRDCFTGGYTLPQFCIDNGIKKPLFVAETKIWQFVWEIYVQFRYDKRLTPQFSFLDSSTGQINFSVHDILAPLKYKNIFEVTRSDNFDEIILLTIDKFRVDNVIHLDELTDYFIRKTYAELPLLNFLQCYTHVKLFLIKYPSIHQYMGGTGFNENLKSLQELRTILRREKSSKVKTSFDRFGYTNAEVLELTGGPPVKTNPDGSTTQGDNESPLVKIRNGKRLTANQPEKFLNRIYFVGSCHDFGINTPFNKTIESYLQKLLNENNLPYRVENESQYYWRRYQDIFYNLNKLTPAPSDIIFVWVDNIITNNLPSIDMSSAFGSLHDYREVYCFKDHVNELGYKILAEKYFELLTANNFFREVEFSYHMPPPIYHRYGIPPQFEQGGLKSFDNPELEAYKEKIRAKKIPIGAIVMNCNPFTLGHQYLVKYAAAKVVKLYIFVVEEDKSEFPFADRFELVKQGVKNFPNVEVLPSGKFIISQQTFSGYFNKSELQDVQVDSSEDVEIFGREIAPELGITIRFAGEEPTDNVTRQYNETMKNILPRYGVEFREIPRKTLGGEIISASQVREALKRGDFDKIKNLMPDTTFNYLRGRFSSAN